MLFHVIGIKEVTNGTENKKHNIDILIKGDSESFIRIFLQKHNIIVLSVAEYNKPSSDFGNLQIDISYKDKQEDLVNIFSYLTDIKSALFLFMTIWFAVENINFTNENKLQDREISDIIKEATIQLEATKVQQKQEVTDKKDQERKMYKDEKLEKTIKIAEKAFIQIEDLLQKVWPRVSQDKIRDIKLMAQELTKLKMWRNDDKMSELLEKIYDKIDAIDTEYLEYMHKNISYPIEGSVVTNIDVISENQKFKKSKKIKAIWAKRDIDDNYYLSFESLWIYIKFLFKDLKDRTKRLSDFVSNSFGYMGLAMLTILIAMSLIFRFNKVSYAIDQNLYHYVFLIKIAIFGLILFFIQKIKKDTISSNILFLIIAIVVAVMLFWFLKMSFSF